MKMIDTTQLRGKKSVLMFSGGKDSLSLWYLLKDHLKDITVLHINTGRLLPEINEVVEYVKARTPHFVQIDTNVDKWNQINGLPTDLMPTSSTAAGIAFGMSNMKLVDRWTCCGANLWEPANKYVTENGFDVVIRGTKKCDTKKLPHSGGDTDLGYTLWLPIIDWSHADVFKYLRSVGAKIPRIYNTQINAPECSTCPAWLSENRGVYLKEHYPTLYAEYKWKLSLIANEILPHIESFVKENA